MQLQNVITPHLDISGKVSAPKPPGYDPAKNINLKVKREINNVLHVKNHWNNSAL
jgi:hypothetical protein